MNNLSLTAKKLDRILQIVYSVFRALAIASIVCVVLIVLAYVFRWDPNMIGTGYATFDVGFLEVEVAQQYAPDAWFVLAQIAFTLAVCCGLFYTIGKCIAYVREILQPMTEGKPFDSIVSRNLKKLATLSICLGILWNFIILSEQIVSIFLFDLPGLLISEKITHVNAQIQVDLAFVVYWAILTLLSYVFRYGEQLQQLADETL